MKVTDKDKDKEKSVFAKRLVELRGDRTQQEVSAAVGIQRATLSMYEDGSRNPNADILCKIAKYYGVSLDYLVGISDVKNYDANIQAVCRYTGLSDHAVAALRHFNGVADVINEIVEDDTFVLFELYQYIFTEELGLELHAREKDSDGEWWEYRIRSQKEIPSSMGHGFALTRSDLEELLLQRICKRLRKIRETVHNDLHYGSED